MEKNQLNQEKINIIYDYIKTHWKSLKIYIWLDIWKIILDVWVTISNSSVQSYLGSVSNTAKWFKEVESFIVWLYKLWIQKDNIFFATENTGTYWHDITNFFEDRLSNVYILNSTLTYSARQFYAKSNFKNDEIDSIIIATTLRDLDNKWSLENDNNKFKRNTWIWFVRRSFSKETDSLRMLFRRLAWLREEKSRVMTSINLYKERLFPEIRDIFKIKSRATSQSILIENFTRSDILWMSKYEFIEKYKNIATTWQKTSRVMPKVLDFYDKVHERWKKQSQSEINKLTWQFSDSFILDAIRFKNERYQLIIQEMNYIKQNIGGILDELRSRGYFIPSFKWIDDNELGIFLWELGSQIYTIHISSLRWFVWRHPNNYTSWWWHIVKASQFSKKDSIIKKFLYVRMYGFSLHNPSFRLYKKLLLQLYWVDTELDGIVKLKNKRKAEVKCGEKLLEIIHSCYKYSCGFDDKRFLNWTIIPLIETMEKNGISISKINKTISDVYWKNIPSLISFHCDKISDGQLIQLIENHNEKTNRKDTVRR